ncbi:DUF5133 domain-containing protein [Streptomyces sp. NPDC006512]|uniref:DUF5133 domain-containing protein n=1 Tax=Streptomyces sp. NPDC006512 TaxID=3154307 RepID=UPI0033B9379F
MTPPGDQGHPPGSSPAPGGAPGLAPAPPGAAVRAVGMVMAATPCSARDARQVLLVAAELARATVAEVAAALVAGADGEPVPASAERALRRAMEAARTVRPVGGRVRVGPAPNRARAEEVLSRLEGCRARLSAAPGDPGAVRSMDDAVYTLCVLMGRRTAYEAVHAARRHLAGPW